MPATDALIREIAAANRILAHNNVVDAYGHISHRDPTNPKRFLLSRSKSPELVEPEDIMVFNLDGSVADGRTDKPYLERFIHAGIYEANSEIMSVVHSHALDVLPFSISTVPLVPVIHVASHCGGHMPVWDIADKFGDTGLLVTNLEQGRDLVAKRIEQVVHPGEAVVDVAQIGTHRQRHRRGHPLVAEVLFRRWGHRCHRLADHAGRASRLHRRQGDLHHPPGAGQRRGGGSGQGRPLWPLPATRRGPNFHSR